MEVVYNNLSQLIEGRLVYFRSTDVEQKNYHRLLWSVPDEWFYLLSKGYTIIVRDISSNKKGGKIERIFLPVLCDVLNNLLGLSKDIKNKQLKEHFKKAMDAVEADKQLKRRILFWKGRINKPVRIVGKTIIVEKEPNPLILGSSKPELRA